MTHSKKRVLVCEDQKAFQEIYTSVLEKLGFEVIAYSDPTQAIALGDGLKDFDAIITDNDMPKMSGLDFLSHVRDLGIWIPVVMISGSVDDLLPNRVTKLRGKFFDKFKVREALKSLVT